MRKSKAEMAFENEIVNCEEVWKNFPVYYADGLDNFKKWFSSRYHARNFFVHRIASGFQAIVYAKPGKELERFINDGFMTN